MVRLPAQLHARLSDDSFGDTFASLLNVSSWPIAPVDQRSRTGRNRGIAAAGNAKLNDGKGPKVAIEH